MTGSVLFTSELDKAPSYGLVASLKIFEHREANYFLCSDQDDKKKTDFMCRGSQSNMDMENICVGH
jgi:hypothetical protein